MSSESTRGSAALSELEPSYINLRTLAVYSSCSVRWLRDRLVDRTHPLPHHRVEGKVLIKKEDFNHWMAQYRQDRLADELDAVVNGVVAEMAHR